MKKLLTFASAALAAAALAAPAAADVRGPGSISLEGTKAWSTKPWAAVAPGVARPTPWAELWGVRPKVIRMNPWLEGWRVRR